MEQENKLKKIIIVLSFFLALTTTALAVRYISIWMKSSEQTTVVVPDNLVGEYDTAQEEVEKESDSGENNSEQIPDENRNQDIYVPEGTVVMEIYETNNELNQHFQVQDLLPGDMITEYFCIKVHHRHDIPIYFNTSIEGETKNLANVLEIKVTNLGSGQVICEDTIARASEKEHKEQLKGNPQEETVLYYRVDVYMPKSAGNEYQLAELSADFHWFAKDEDILLGRPGGIPTGDSFSVILWLGVGVISSLVLVCTIRKKKERENE